MEELSGVKYMKFIHLADLHIGKRVNEVSMLEDQEYILRKILEVVDEEKPDGVLIAGDVYDKPVPGTEAVRMLDFFLTSLAKRQIKVFLISGNHDSAERIAFGANLMTQTGIHVSQVYDGEILPVKLEDELGELNVYMLPFIKPLVIRNIFPEDKIETYTDAVECAIRHMNIDRTKRNVLVAHQFVTGAVRCDSEEVSVGGMDNVDAGVFEGFDYVALGHIHGPQNVGSERIRYAGTPLKYSFSEINHEKSVTVVEINKDVVIRTVKLHPRRDMIELRGKYNELVGKENYEKYDRDAYIRVILTDEEEEPDAIGKMRVIYPNIMKLEYDNQRTKGCGEVYGAREEEMENPLQMFGDFYQMQNNQEMSIEQEKYMKMLIDEVWEA